MLAGDVYTQGVEVVVADDYFNMQPPEGVEIIVHNINHSTDILLEFFDGTTAIPGDTMSGQTPWVDLRLHCTNSSYYRVKNVSETLDDNLIACDGVVTKVA